LPFTYLFSYEMSLPNSETYESSAVDLGISDREGRRAHARAMDEMLPMIPGAPYGARWGVCSRGEDGGK
jgi:hypothetical protein